MARYAYCREDGSYFGEDNLSIVDVPDNLETQEEVEDFLQNVDLEEKDLYDPTRLKEVV